MLNSGCAAISQRKGKDLVIVFSERVRACPRRDREGMVFCYWCVRLACVSSSLCDLGDLKIKLGKIHHLAVGGGELRATVLVFNNSQPPRLPVLLFVSCG